MSGDDKEIEFGTLAEQQDEAFMDDRSDADDDLEKARLKFPDSKLYGREKELDELHRIYNSMRSNDHKRQVVFLSGYSGIGKSSLVAEFVKQLQEKRGGASYISGKFSQIKSGQPFTAIAQAMHQYVRQLVQRATKEELRQLRERLEKVDIWLGSTRAVALGSTLVPGLEDLLTPTNSKSALSVDSSSKSSGMGHDMNLIQFAFRYFIKTLASPATPIIFFVDDLQYSDAASVHVLQAFLKDSSLSNIMFVGSYRLNEMDDDHPMHATIQTLKEEAITAHFIEVSNLSPKSIASFIADTTHQEPEEIALVVEAIYSKTLGNIFFVKQALEELVRKNALFYDVMVFQWQFGDVTRVELEQFLSDGVIEMVQSKLRTMPKNLQTALSVSAYVNNTIELGLLSALLLAESIQVDTDAVHVLMDTAFSEGLVLMADESSCSPQCGAKYKFAHDKIREAACEAVTPGEERFQLLQRISAVLLKRGSTPKDNWMLFAAARHLNSIPADMCDQIELAQLNVKVAKIAVADGAFEEAANFLRPGVNCLGSASCWKENYHLTLEIKNCLAEAEQWLGNSERSLELADEILQNSRTLSDKGRAHFISIEALSKTNSNYCMAVEKAVEILKHYNIDLPSMPTDRQVKREKFRLKMALRGRSLTCLSNFDIAEEATLVAEMRIAQTAMRLANFGKLQNISAMIGARMLREALARKLVTKDFAFMLVFMGQAMKKQEKYDKAFALANIAISLMNRFPEEKGLEYAKAKMGLYGSLSCLRLSFREAIETFLELNKLLISLGQNDMGLGAGMLSMYAFLNASLPLNALFEPKLTLFEETSSCLGKKTFVAVFSLIRQCLYNLQGSDHGSSSPTEVKGMAFDEEAVLQSFDDGPARKMTFRDISIMRLKLAVIFDDEAVMDEMLDRLDEFPVFDIPVERQHIRMSYVGFASLILAQSMGKKHAKWAKQSLQFFKKLSQFGSPNAQPVYACLKALKRPSLAGYDEAIHICANLGLFNLVGLMNERCGTMLSKQNEKQPQQTSSNDHVEYLKCALWSYHDWGAMGKVKQMQTRFPVLNNAIKEKAPSQLSSLRRQAVMLGVPRVVPLSDLNSSA